MNILTALGDRARHLLRAWFAISVALYAATVLTCTVWLVVLLLLAAGDAGLGNALAWLPMGFVITVIYAILVALAFSVLATPLLMLQRFIVGPRAPYLRPGYAAVALYGPMLLALMDHGWVREAWPLYAAYEAIALVATLIYVRLGDSFDLFPRVAPTDTPPPATLATA